MGSTSSGVKGNPLQSSQNNTVYVTVTVTATATGKVTITIINTPTTDIHTYAYMDTRVRYLLPRALPARKSSPSWGAGFPAEKINIRTCLKYPFEEARADTLAEAYSRRQ